ncbi:hypothetical protein [Natronobiforma cellulositropha]|uniref:hypothetical protein n=1 Tax=Natronobiforma cellulositropha TaxID=1679076 RepID=UPI002950053B|nr:hypothetical protein [Natronobiforma cellulositropha]
MARDTPVQKRTDSHRTSSRLPNLLTIEGQGYPVSYEITVGGEIEAVGDPRECATVSGSAVEGAIDAGVTRFRFSSAMANVTFVDETPDGGAPTVRVEYDSPLETDEAGPTLDEHGREDLDAYCARMDDRTSAR